MTYLDVQAPLRKKTPAVVAGVALFLAGAISIAGLNVFGERVGLGFIPYLVLAIWPRRANTLVSLGFVFFGGFFTDWSSGGIVGQSSLIFVLIWGFLRPELRSSPFSPVGLFLVWLAICGLALVVMFLSGMFVLGVQPDFAVLGRQMILATALLPLFLLMRRGVEMRFSDREEWG